MFSGRRGPDDLKTYAEPLRSRSANIIALSVAVPLLLAALLLLYRWLHAFSEAH